jgi:cell division protein FtsW (lipid II flippase)
MKPRAACYTLLFSVAALLAIGLVAIYSVGMTQTKLAGHFQKQTIWAVVGTGAFTVAVMVPYEWLRQRAFWLLGVALVLLVAVALPGVGHVFGNARRWLVLGPVNFQPSEFAKIALILALALYAEIYHRQMRTLRHGFLVPALFILPVLALIGIEPDRGTAALLAVICGVLLLVAGVRWSFVLPAAGVWPGRRGTLRGQRQLRPAPAQCLVAPGVLQG